MRETSRAIERVREPSPCMCVFTCDCVDMHTHAQYMSRRLARPPTARSASQIWRHRRQSVMGEGARGRAPQAQLNSPTANCTMRSRGPTRHDLQKRHRVAVSTKIDQNRSKTIKNDQNRSKSIKIDATKIDQNRSKSIKIDRILQNRQFSIKIRSKNLAKIWPKILSKIVILLRDKIIVKGYPLTTNFS